MLIIIFILLFTNYFQVNSLICMQNEEKDIIDFANALSAKIKKIFPSKNSDALFKSDKGGCVIVQSSTETLPDDTTINGRDNCELRSSTSDSDTTESCFAEIIIEYATNTMIIKLNSITDQDGELFTALVGTGKKSMIQYEIKSDFNSDIMGLATRIQCNTGDNCALNEVRKVLPKLTNSAPRLALFQKIKKILSEPESDQLSCLNDDNHDALCLGTVRFCEFVFRKDENPDKSCKTELIHDATKMFSAITGIFIENYNIKYKYDQILLKDDHLTFDKNEHFELAFLCKTDRCNDDKTAQNLDDLLNIFINNPSNDPNAVVIDSKGNQKPANYKSPIARQKKNQATNLFSYRSILIFIFFFQIILF